MSLLDKATAEYLPNTLMAEIMLETANDEPSQQVFWSMSLWTLRVRIHKMANQDQDGVDAHTESQISTIKNHAKGADIIQFMPSTGGRPLNGTNDGDGDRLKQAGGFFNDASLQKLSGDFRTIALHQSGHKDDTDTVVTIPKDDGASTDPKSPFGDRHGPGFVLAESPSPPNGRPAPSCPTISFD